MNIARIIAVVGMFALLSEVSAVDPEGFGDLQFGASKDAALNKLQTEYSMRRKFPLPMAPLVGQGGIELHIGDESVELRNYPYAHRRYTVKLFFNLNGRFYGYTLEGRPYEDGKVSVALRDELLALGRDFQSKFGSHGSTLRVTLKGVEQRAETRFVVREDEFFSISLSVSHQRAGRGTGRVLVVSAAVCDKMMRSETQLREADAPQASSQ